MSLLIVPLLYPDFGRVTEFLRPHFRITSGLPTTRNVARPLNTSAFMGTNPEKEAQPKVNECIALNGPSGRPFIESAHNLHELASHQNDRAPQYEGNAIE